MLTGVAYCSSAQLKFDHDSLLELARQSSDRNAKIQITGYLYYKAESFLQYLEGPEEAITCLMKKISKDPRHKILQSLPLGNVEKRLFPQWYMRFIGDDFRIRNAETVEDELKYILRSTSKNLSAEQDLSAAVFQVTRRIASLDW